MFSILLRIFGGGIIKSLLKSSFGNFLKLNWKYIFIVLMIGFFVWKWNYMKNTIIKLEAERVLWIAENKRFAENELKYKANIKEQNDSIILYKKMSNKAKEKLNKAIKRASQAKVDHNESLLKLSKKTPQNESCEATINFMVDIIGDLKW